MQVKASSMIKFGWVMLSINLLLGVFFTIMQDRFRAIVSLGGVVLWVVGIWSWTKNAGEDR